MTSTHPRPWSPRAEAIAFVAVLAGTATVGFLVFSKLSYDWNWSGIWEYREVFIRGLGTTLAVSAGALVVSIAIGLGAALGMLSGSRVLRLTCSTYVALIRGTPLLVQLLIGYYLVARALGIDGQISAGILLLALFSGAYLAEIIRGGVASISESQIEAARASGLDRAQTFRHVIVPQAARRVLPALAGQFVSLVKDSSLLCVIGIQEFTYQARAANSATYSSLEGFIPLAIGYLILTLPISWWTSRLERKLNYDD